MYSYWIGFLFFLLCLVFRYSNYIFQISMMAEGVISISFLAFVGALDLRHNLVIKIGIGRDDCFAFPAWLFFKRYCSLDFSACVP